jgi:hypothetical protein
VSVEVRRVWNEQDIRGLGAATDLVTAAAILGIGRTTAHTLARAGRFPVPVIRVGRRYRVPVAPILRLLTLDPAEATPPDPSSAAPSRGRT